MPQPRTLIGSWREIRQTWKKQRADHGYQYETPLPKHGDKKTASRDPLEAAIGDLPPKSF